MGLHVRGLERLGGERVEVPLELEVDLAVCGRRGAFGVPA